jgi:Beta-lactamase
LYDQVTTGAAVGVVVDASRHVTAVSGYHGSPDEPVDAPTVLEIGSLTKLFAGTLLPILRPPAAWGSRRPPRRHGLRPLSELPFGSGSGRWC